MFMKKVNCNDLSLKKRFEFNFLNWFMYMFVFKLIENFEKNLYEGFLY